MSPTLLEIPPFQLSEKVEQLTQDEVRGLCFLLACVAGIQSFRSKSQFVRSHDDSTDVFECVVSNKTSIGKKKLEDIQVNCDG